MIIGVPKETFVDETRVALTPAAAGQLVKRGCRVLVETQAGAASGHPDEQYTTAGAEVSARPALLKQAQLILRVRPPAVDEIAGLSKGAVHISFLDPFGQPEVIQAFASAGVTAISMEMIPRSTIAQKMDALSSQANLAGYVAVVLAAERINKILPMMMTPAGTIAPCRVFVIGAGVAGLQAIATARRLGARVEAFDTRPVVEEQVRSLGAKFVKIDLGETGQTEQGYAKALTPEQLELQRQGMAKVCAQSDIVITTAQIFGKKAPRIITQDMIQQMAPGSVIVDMAVESGGNVEGSRLGEEVLINGVRVIGLRNLPGRVAAHASQMYAQNLLNLLETFWDKESSSLKLDLGHDILKSCVITHGGSVVNERIAKK